MKRRMFSDELIIITGGSSGLGKALAERLLLCGARLALIARTTERLLAVQKGLGPSHEGRVGVFPCNVADRSDVEKMTAEVSASMGLPDILINSAGILSEGPFEKLSPDAFRTMMDTNFFGALHCIRSVLPLFRQTGRGRIVNIGSVASLLGVYGYSAYCSSKHALRGLTETLRLELKPLNISVHLVCPPEFASPMVEAMGSTRSPDNITMAHSIPVLDANAVAQAVIRGMEINRYEIIPGMQTKAVIRLSRWLPSIGRAVADRLIRPRVA